MAFEPQDFSKRVIPITVNDESLRYEFEETAKITDDQETPLKRPVAPSYRDGEVGTLYKRPSVSSGNTGGDDSTQFAGMQGPDSMETPYKSPVTEDVFFPGSQDRSFSQDCVADAVVSKGSSRSSTKDSGFDCSSEKDQNRGARPKEKAPTPTSPYLNAFPDAPTKENDIEIDEKVELPFELAAEHYDVLILNHKDDLVRAINLKKVIQKFCVHKDGSPVKVLVLGDDDNEFMTITQRVQEMAEASARCTMCFMLMSPSFCDNEFFKLMKDEFLWESITDEKKKWSVIPLHTSQPYKTPFGLGSLKGVHIETDIVSGVNFDDDDPYIEDLKPKMGFMKSVCPMIQKKVHLRHERERELEKRRLEYKEKELHRRRIAASKEKTEQLRLQRQREKELKEAEEKNKQRANDPLPPPPDTPESELSHPTFKARTANWQVHVTQNNYIGAALAGQMQQDDEDDDDDDDEIDWDSGHFEIVRGDPPEY